MDGMNEIKIILERIESKLDGQINLEDLKGTNRKCDSLGRLTLPVNIRKYYDIDENTEIKICEYNNCIVLIPQR